MPGEAMTTVVGFFGKLPAHGDFVRRGLPGAVATSLDDWLQDEFAREDDPAGAIAALEPVRFASTAIVTGQVGLGVIAASSDRVGRSYILAALRLTDHPSGALPASIPATWDDWCGRAEALLTAARGSGWTADDTQTALSATAHASAVELVADPPFIVSDLMGETTAWWRSTLNGVTKAARSEGLPRGAAFAELIGLAETRT